MSQTYDENTESKESETLPNNLKGDHDSFGRPKSDAHISVYNFVLKEERLGKYTAYSIKGTDKEGDFETRRRYSEFDKIRAVLVSRWPGVYIPPLPPKDAMHNLEAAFIEERRKRLNEFCKRVSDIPHLHYSEEFQLFIRSPPGDLERSLQAFQKIDYDDLLTKYTKSFNYLADREINNETDLKITGFKLFLTKAKGKFESLKKISRLATTAKKRYYEQLANFHSMTCVPYEKNVFSEYHLNQNAKNVFLNMEEGQEAVNEKLKQVAERESLEHINNWIENEAREIDAFLEAISYKDKYDQLRNKTQNKQKSQSDDLQKVMAGKKTLKTLFSNKPKETKISNMEKTIAAVSKDVEALNGIYDIITLVLAFDEIERFKKNKIDRYYQMLYLSSGNELLNLKSLTEYWQSILANPNVASLSVE